MNLASEPKRLDRFRDDVTLENTYIFYLIHYSIINHVVDYFFLSFNVLQNLVESIVSDLFKCSQNIFIYFCK